MWEDFVLWFAAVAVICVGLIVMVGLWIEHHDDQDSGPSTEDERIGSLTRRYVHGDLTLDEFEEQIDVILNGEQPEWHPTVSNDPGVVWMPRDNHPHAPISIHTWQSVNPHRVLYPTTSGTALVYPEQRGGTVIL